MSLNITPRPKKIPPPLPEPEAPVLIAAVPAEPLLTAGEHAGETGEVDDAGEPRKRTRRGSRGGRGRGKARTEATGEETVAEAVPLPAIAAAEEAPPRATRRRRPAAEAEPEVAPDAVAAPPAKAPARASRRKPAAPEAEAAPAAVVEEAPARAPRKKPVRPPEDLHAHAAVPLSDAGTAAVLRAIDIQNRQMEHLIELQEQMAKRIGNGALVVAPPARVGVFVDAANVELAIDRLRTRLDWGKILKMLTEGRELVRAMAYSPIHDDPSVSMETQRFVEPFLDRGYKVVTKPLKRFQDGTIKANLDIELALDVITMLDRLDIVCLVSGDGDFQRLVEVVQARGVRVEVVGVGSSVAGNLRNAADAFIDLANRTRDLKV